MFDSRNDSYSEHRLITQLFDTQPDSVVWFIPKFKEGVCNPTDFEVGYCNTAACVILRDTRSRIVGSSLLDSSLMDEVSRKAILEQCIEIWGSGQHKEFTYYSPGLNKHFHVQRSKLQEGILSITRDYTSFVKAQEEKDQKSKLLNKIIETSTTGISLYEAIRDKSGKISDFRLVLANQKCNELTSFTLEELYKYTVKELMVIRGHVGYFEMVSKVVETGEPLHIEMFSQVKNKWIGLSVEKFNDGYILNYIDIDANKSLEKMAKDQADMLKGILNASITGLITMEAIYSPSGQIADFKFVLLNDAAKKLLNLEDDYIQKTYLSLFPNAKANGFFDLYTNALKTGEPVSKEIFYKDDRYNGWYHISVSKMNDHTLVQSFSDINHARTQR